jgi:hypothetical protein
MGLLAAPKRQGAVLAGSIPARVGKSEKVGWAGHPAGRSTSRVAPSMVGATFFVRSTKAF